MLHKRVFAKKIFQFVISVLLIASSVSVICFSLSLTQFSKAKMAATFVNDIGTKELYALEKNDYVEEKYNEFYQPIFENQLIGMNIEGFENPDEISYIYWFSDLANYIVDNSLDENHIVVTDFLLYKLKECKIINFEAVDDAIGEKLIIKSQELIIDSVKKTEYSDYLSNLKEIYTYEVSGCFNSFVWINEITFKQISIELDYVDLFCVNSNGNTELSDELHNNEVTLGNFFLSDSNYLGVKIGDQIEIDFKVGAFTNAVTKTVKVVGIDESSAYFVEISKDLCDELNEELFEMSKYYKGYYFYDISNEMIEDLYSIYDTSTNSEIMSGRDCSLSFNFYDEWITICNRYSNYEVVCTILITISFVFTIVWVAYLIYSRLKLSKRSFNVLELYGFYKNDKLKILLVEYLYQVAVSCIMCIPWLIVMYGKINSDINQLMGTSIYYNCYNTKYVLYSALIVYSVLFVITIAAYFISLFQKRKSHIS